MIVVEERLTELFAQLPEIQINPTNLNKPFFSWGKKEELNRYVEKTEENVLYPLIWQLPTEESYNRLSELTETKLILIVATRETRGELYNPQRWEGSFKQVLNPLAEYIIQALENGSTTRIIDIDDISIFKEPNYSDNSENGVIDKWDAIRLECNVEFNDNCLKTIKWK